MHILNLPTFAYRIQSFKTGYQIFDVVRRKYVKLTPEEWVRQHFLHYLVDYLSYPKALVSLERAVSRHTLRHRPDIVVYDRSAQPLMLVECKAPHVAISNRKVFMQIGRYNAHFNAPLLVMTNGMEHFCWQLDGTRSRHRLLSTVPHFDNAVACVAYTAP